MDFNDILKEEPVPQVYNPSKVTRWLTTLISYVFHPLFMPILLAIIIYYLTPERVVGISKQSQMQLLVTLLVNTVFFPLLSIVLMKFLGFVSSIKLPTRKDRIGPLMAIMIFYFWAYQVIKNIPGQNTDITTDNMYVFAIFFMGNFLALIGVYVCTIFTKISMHTAASGGAVAIMIIIGIVGKVNVLPAVIITTAVAGVVGTARLLNNAHKPFDIWLGYIVGFVAMFIAYWWWT